MHTATQKICGCYDKGCNCCHNYGVKRYKFCHNYGASLNKMDQSKRREHKILKKNKQNVCKYKHNGITFVASSCFIEFIQLYVQPSRHRT
jgi:hypothetical protein